MERASRLSSYAGKGRGVRGAATWQKLLRFAVRIVKLCDRMAPRGLGARHIAAQLVRCGTSIGANAEEAQEGQTKADSIAKMSVSSKEARESHWWLRLGVAAGVVKKDEVEWSSPDRGRSVQLPLTPYPLPLTPYPLPLFVSGRSSSRSAPEASRAARLAPRFGASLARGEVQRRARIGAVSP